MKEALTSVDLESVQLGASEPASTLLRTLQTLDPDTLRWLSGYAAGMAAARAPSNGAANGAVLANGAAAALVGASTATLATTAAALPAKATATPLTILVGSQTGNGRMLAMTLAARLRDNRVETRVVHAADVDVRALAKERFVVVVVSTHGDGDPPDEFRALYDQLLSKRAPQLAELRYAVVGLGDSSYQHFCATARIVDERLAALGAERLQPRVDCDVDIDAGVAAFLAGGLPAIAERWRVECEPKGGQPQALASVTPLRSGQHTPVTVIPQPTKGPAVVLENTRLTAPGIRKDVRHLELQLPRGQSFQPGDALLVHGRSDAAVVADVCALLRVSADEVVVDGGKSQSLGEALSHKELTRLTRPLLVAHLERVIRESDRTALQAVIDGDANTFCRRRQFPDLLAEYPAAWTPQALVTALRALQPRAYSLANSLLHAPGEAHLTVAVVDDGSFPRRRRGVVSGALQSARVDDSITVEVEENPRFRLPRDGGKDVIFIGPGTGVAPFRAFLQHRVADGASGKNWLFFGEATLRGHFLYQREWLDARRQGQLHRLDVAFSRDQAHKIYVQDRIREQGAELWRWLDGGAHLYVCGDATRMAKDVENALIDVAKNVGGKDDDDATAWLQTLGAAGRYQKDVY
jgi:sulfite reductase (NADPH) flavoprotein alpha-component